MAVEFKDYEYLGDWLEHLLGLPAGTPVVAGDSIITRHLGYQVGEVVHRVSLMVARGAQTFQTASQRDRVLGGFRLEFGELRDMMRTPEGRQKLYGIKEG